MIRMPTGRKIPQMNSHEGVETSQHHEVDKEKSSHIKKIYQDILNVIPEGVALINSSNKLVYSNKTLANILHCSKNQIANIIINLATKTQMESTSEYP